MQDDPEALSKYDRLANQSLKYESNSGPRISTVGQPPEPEPEPEPEEKIKTSKLPLASARSVEHAAEAAGQGKTDKAGQALIDGVEPEKLWEPPACPHLEVLKLWAEVLPALPQHEPDLWRGARADHLRARWRETAVAKHWDSQQQGLAFFRKFFTYIGKSQFLTGRARSRDPDKRPFIAELEWVVKPINWAKIIEGKYNGEA
jgi:hypothetical protein